MTPPVSLGCHRVSQGVTPSLAEFPSGGLLWGLARANRLTSAVLPPTKVSSGNLWSLLTASGARRAVWNWPKSGNFGDVSRVALASMSASLLVCWRREAEDVSAKRASASLARLATWREITEDWQKKASVSSWERPHEPMTRRLRAQSGDAGCVYMRPPSRVYMRPNAARFVPPKGAGGMPSPLRRMPRG